MPCPANLRRALERSLHREPRPTAHLRRARGRVSRLDVECAGAAQRSVRWHVDAGTRTSYDLVTNSSIIAANHAQGDPANNIETIHTITGANILITLESVSLPEGTLTDDPMLAPLADNGGATLTHTLLAGSPAIDAGNNAASLDTDQRGEGFVRVLGAAADIGAFEAQGEGGTIFRDGFDGALPRHSSRKPIPLFGHCGCAAPPGLVVRRIFLNLWRQRQGSSAPVSIPDRSQLLPCS